METSLARDLMSDDEWAFFERFILAVRAPNGRKPTNHRLVLDGIFWIARTGAPWRDLPESLGHWSSVYHRWRRWCVRGWCELIFEHLRPMVPANGRGWPKVPPAEPVEWPDEGGAGRQHNLQGPSERRRRRAYRRDCPGLVAGLAQFGVRPT